MNYALKNGIFRELRSFGPQYLKYLNFPAFNPRSTWDLVLSFSKSFSLSLSAEMVALKRCASQGCFFCCSQIPTRTASRSFVLARRHQRAQSQRWQSNDATAATPTNPKIAGIVDRISELTLLETADLVSSLKVGKLLTHLSSLNRSLTFSPRHD